MNRFRFGLIFAGLMILATAESARGAITCSASDFAGTYAFYTTGTLMHLPPEAAALAGPFSQAGTFTSDGNGHVIIKSKASYNGFIQPGDAEATYSITPGCVITFTLTLPFPLSIPSTFTAVLSGNNRENFVMITDPPGSVIVGRHTKQDTRKCTPGDVFGAYQIDINGSVSGPPARAGLFQRIGRFEFDGSGNFTATSLANYAGNLASENFEGTYSVDDNCFFTVQYTFSGEDITLWGALGGNGQSGAIMVASPGWAVSGLLRAQQQ